MQRSSVPAGGPVAKSPEHDAWNTPAPAHIARCRTTGGLCCRSIHSTATRRKTNASGGCGWMSDPELALPATCSAEPADVKVQSLW
jgi:hypothetical protein